MPSIFPNESDLVERLAALSPLVIMGLGHSGTCLRTSAWQVEQFEQFRQHVDPARILEPRFEDLCLTPDRTMAKVCDFMDMPITPECPKVLDGMNRKKDSEFQRHPDEEIRRIEERPGDVVKRWNCPLQHQH